ncbi:hypothetical protein OO010_15745, partial [Flavobacteriaceae bacterium KMM 6898]|nr:hypothetical protein [Flavobacteriaceae bacterium KMM 6898]
VVYLQPLWETEREEDRIDKFIDILIRQRPIAGNGSWIKELNNIGLKNTKGWVRTIYGLQM